MACVNLDRDFIGMDMEEDYIKIAEARIKKAQELNKIKQQKLL
jgi:DNA modification methylase